MEPDRLVRRAPSRPLVHLGERAPASLVQPRLGARFPAYPAKERDFALDVRAPPAAGGGPSGEEKEKPRRA